MRRLPLLPAALAAAVLVGSLAGCSPSTRSGTAGANAAIEASPTPFSDVTSPSPEAVVASPIVSPTQAASPTPVRPQFVYDVAAAKRRLTELKYYVGPIDARRGSSLRSAVMAFQKVQGLGADGTVGPATLAALKTPRSVTLRGTTPANRVEIDLTRQVLYVVKGGVLTRIMPVSSGNGATYLQKNGAKAKALTPVGFYKIQRRILGERKADLGTLYDPQYFYRGWAIHGSNSVPSFPASHGCVRVTRTDAKYLLNAISVGMSVHLYGGRHTFTAGSSAPGTDNPTGDTPADTAPSPTPSPTRAPSSPTPSPTATPQSSPSPSPSPSTNG